MPLPRPLVLAIALSIFGASSARAEDQLLWFWFEKCGQPPLKIEVLVEGKVVLDSKVDICRRARSGVLPESQDHLTVKFKAARDFSWENYVEGLKTKAGMELELDMWQAGAEPDALTIGVVVTTSKQIYTHTYHVALPSGRVESEIAAGVLVRSAPASQEVVSRKVVAPPNSSLDRTRDK